MGLAPRPPLRPSFYADVLQCCTSNWTSERVLRRRLDALGWKPEHRELLRMLALLKKHGKLELERRLSTTYARRLHDTSRS